MGFQQLLTENAWILSLLSLWVIPWKGYALWLAARKGAKWWFIALLVINTLALLEIAYIFYFSKRKPKAPETPDTPKVDAPAPEADSSTENA